MVKCLAQGHKHHGRGQALNPQNCPAQPFHVCNLFSDVNECSRSSLNRCSRIQTCRNTAGGYSCLCPRGFYNSLQQLNICLGKNL